MSRQILSIDIRNQSIAAVVLNTGLTNNAIEACAFTTLPTDATEEPPRRVALRRLLEKFQLKGSPVVVSLPADQTFFRTVNVPFKDDKKIRQVLPYELEPNLPIAVDELIIDYQMVPDPTIDGLLTTAITRSAVEAVTADLAALELRPQLIVPGDFPLALGLSLYAEEIENQTLLLEVGIGKASLFVLDNRKVALVRLLSADITSESGIESLALAIRQTLTAFADSRPQGFSAQTLFLSGPALVNPNTVRHLSEALEIPGKLINLRTQIPKLETISELADWQPCLHDGALAMAMIEAENHACLNFHRSSSMLRNFWTAYQPYLRGPGILLILAVLLSLGGVLIDSHMLSKQLKEINAKMENVFTSTFPGTKLVLKDDPKGQMVSELKKARSSGMDAEQSGPQMRVIDILQQLSQLIPKEVDVVFTRLVLGSDGLNVSGEAAAFNVVDDVKNRLEKAGLFKQVTIASANMDKAGNKVLFKLKIDL
ncbi:MAG: type II secretion system protein GspL [Desulfobacteraceae bacterium]|nr:type II secretion system protein GspL [Desulfobacteraceae bacterium]